MQRPLIIEEDDHYLYIGKPAAFDSAAVTGGRPDSVAAWLLENYPHIQRFGYSDQDNGLLNRLDYETSGLILAAKSMRARDGFLELTKKNGVTKRYLALTEGMFVTDQVIEAPIGARGRNSKLVRVYLNPRKRDRALPAKTICHTISVSKKDGISLVEASIVVGRRHQIRAHLSFKGHPLIGDTLYGSTKPLSDLVPNYPSSFFLHSTSIAFIHPLEKIETHIVCKPPVMIEELIRDLTKQDLGAVRPERP